MLIDWTEEFDRWYTRLEEAAAAGDENSRAMERLVDAELAVLRRLTEVPLEETPSLKRVRRSRTYPVWRVAHPFRPGFAVRIIVWFPDDQHAVVALFGANKASMGDVFYNSVGSRADAAIEGYLRQVEAEKESKEKKQEEGECDE